eukprot:RCo033008
MQQMHSSAGGVGDTSAALHRDRRSRWKEIHCTGDIPQGRIGHTVTVHGASTMYLWGGVNENMERESKYLDDFYRYNFEKKEWREVPLLMDKPQGRAFHSAVMHQGCMVIFGGCNGRGRFNQVYRINGETGVSTQVNPTTDAPSTRYCHTAVMHDNKMVVFGGKCGGRNSNKRLADMYSFDLETATWTVVDATGDKPCSRSAHICVVYCGKMLMFGGRNADGRCCEDLYEFSFSNNEWRKVEVPAMWSNLFVRARHSVVVHNDKLVTFAGWNGKKKLNDLFQYNLDSQTCTLLHDSDENDPTLPCRRECHSAVMVGHSMVLFGGRFRGLFMNDNYEYVLDPISLKEFCRMYIAAHSAHIHYNQPRYGLPTSLAQYVRMYETRELSSDERKALEASKKK